MIPVLTTILGPTACGKTSLATALAYHTDGEIISADSRQVFRGMDIGTGKDLKDYIVEGREIPYHIIDICSPAEEYNAYRFVNDFKRAFNDIVDRGKTPIMCGGTGMYIDAIVREYHLADAPIDEDFRKSVEGCSDEELTRRLAEHVKLHNHTDTEDRERLVRALEIQEFLAKNPDRYTQLPKMEHRVWGVAMSRDVVVKRIEKRLQERLKEGMIEEVEGLLKGGVSKERMLKFGLEYKYVTMYLVGECDYESMYEKLFTEIRRFSKRQMTWFRRMERAGVEIRWIDGMLPLKEKVSVILQQR